MLDWHSELTAALEHARKNGYLVMNRWDGDPEEDPYLCASEVWIEDCEAAEQPYVRAECEGDYAWVILDTETVPYLIDDEGLLALTGLVPSSGNGCCSGHMGYSCRVPIAEMDSMAQQMLTIARTHGHRMFEGWCFEAVSPTGELIIVRQPPREWGYSRLSKENKSSHDPVVRRRAQEELTDYFRHQSPEEMAERGYTIVLDDYEAYDIRRALCTEQSVPLVAVICSSYSNPHMDRFRLLLDMATTDKRLSPEGRKRATYLCHEYMDLDGEIWAEGSEVISCAPIHVEFADKLAREMFRIAQTYVCDAPVEPEGDPE